MVALAVTAMSTTTVLSQPKEATDTVSGYRTAGIVQAVSTMEAGAYATANVVGSQVTVVAAANEQAQVAYPEWQDRLMANVDEFLYVRATASTDSDIVGKMYKGRCGRGYSDGGRLVSDRIRQCEWLCAR